MALRSGRVGIHPSQVDPITGMLLTSPSGASDLSDLDDVSINDPEEGQQLVYNGEKWENHFASISPVTPATLQSLQDVLISSPADGQTLEYDADNDKWVNVFASISPLTLSQLQDVVITDPQDDDYLIYDSSDGKWINSGSAPAPSYIDKTLTIYSAVEDLISFTDAAGITHTEQFAENQSSKTITFKINPSGSTSITFTSSVAKDPDSLAYYYSKTVTITDSTSSVYLMPNDDVLYWWGYESSNLETVSSTNGWSGFTFVAPTYNTNSITIASSSGLSAVGTKNKITGSTAYMINTGVVISGNYGSIDKETTKAITFGSGNYTPINSNTIKKYSLAISNNYVIVETDGPRTNTLHAFWYE